MDTHTHRGLGCCHVAQPDVLFSLYCVRCFVLHHEASDLSHKVDFPIMEANFAAVDTKVTQ